MKHLIQVSCLAVFIVALAATSYAQVAGDYRSVASLPSGSLWSAAATWETYNGSAWSAASTAPTTTANVTIVSGDTVSLDPTTPITIATLKINDGGSLVFPGTPTLNCDITVNGNLSSSSSANLTVSGNINCSGPNASVKFGSNGAKITGVAGKTFTLTNGANLTPATNNGAPPGTGNIISQTIVNMTFVIDNSVAMTTVTFKNSGNCSLSNPPNGQVFGNLKFTTSSGAGPKSLSLGSDITILGSLAFEPASTAGLGSGDASAWTWNLGSYKIRTIGTGKTVTVAQLSNHSLIITGTADTLFPGFANYNFVPPSNANCKVNYASTTGTQFVAGGTYQKLAVSGGGAKTLLGNTAVNDTLTLTSGILALGSKTLTVVGTASSSATSYVVTNGPGVLQQAINASGSGLFPVGTASTSAPAIIKNNATSVDTFSVKVVADSSGTNSGADRVKLRWTVGRLGSSAYTPAFSWPSAAEGANITANRASNAKLFDLASGSTAIAATLTGSDPYLLTATATSSRNTSFAIGTNATGLTGVSETNSSIPEYFGLGQNYPNPFNPSTSFTYQIAKEGFVSVKVYDVLGKEVATLVNEVKHAGTYPTTWNAAGLGSGMYFYKMQAGSFTETKKMILMK